MRMSTDIQRTNSKGQAISPKYPGRVKGEKDGSVDNIYATVDPNGTFRLLQGDEKGRCPDLMKAEEDAYVELFQEAVDQIAENYRKDGHKDDIKYTSAKQWLTDPKYCPYRMSFSLGDMDEHASLEDLEKASKELVEHITAKYPHIRVASYALHKDSEGGKGDVHIALIPAADKKTRKGIQMVGKSGLNIKEFSFNKALAQDGQEKYFKDADGQIKAITDPDIKDPKLMKDKQFCNEVVGFTQEIRQHMFEWCEQNLGLELERNPDEERSRKPYDKHQSANARLSTKDYIARDKAKKAREKDESKVQELKQEQERLLDENDGISRQNHEASIRQREAQQQNAGPALDLSLLQ